jgi:DNA ligase 1
LRTKVPAPWPPADILLARLAGARTGREPTGKESRVRYRIVAEACRDLEEATARLELINRLASLVRQTPTELLPMVALLCQGQIAPDFAGVELGLNERLGARAVATSAGVPPEQVLAFAREVGDLGLAAERLLGELDPGRPP